MRIVLIAAAAVLAGHTVSAQTVDPAFQKARAARNAAIMAGDEEGLRRYTTDDFIYVSLEGQVMTRVERAAANQGNNELPARQPLTDAKVRVYGDTIITSGRGELNVRGVMKPVRVMQVWVKRTANGRSPTLRTRSSSSTRSNGRGAMWPAFSLPAPPPSEEP